MAHALHEFPTAIEEVASIFAEGDRAMERLWKKADREQTALLDALPPFDHHDPMPFVKAARELAAKIEAEIEMQREAA
jgi:hypothetical protein